MQFVENHKVLVLSFLPSLLQIGILNLTLQQSDLGPLRFWGPFKSWGFKTSNVLEEQCVGGTGFHNPWRRDTLLEIGKREKS